MAAASLDLWDVISRYILPPILGGGGGLVAAWLNWDVEKRRDKRASRRALVERWRNEILEAWPEGGVAVYGGSATGKWANSAAFRSLEPHLSKELRADIRSPSIQVVHGARDPLGVAIAREIDRIERDWDLI